MGGGGIAYDAHRMKRRTTTVSTADKQTLLTSPVLIFSFFKSAYASCNDGRRDHQWREDDAHTEDLAMRWRTCPAVSSISTCLGAPSISMSFVYMSPIVGIYCIDVQHATSTVISCGVLRVLR